jgi:DNA-binding transcriptional LysR family regulator
MTFTEAEPPQSLAALRAGDCDVAVIFANQDVDAGELEEDLSLLVTRHLLDDELRLATPKNHPLAQTGTATLADFASEDWIAGCPRCRAHLVGLADKAGFRPTVSFEIEDYVAQLGLVTAGLGVALVPDIILNAAKHDDVATLSLVPASHRQILAVTTPDLLRVPAVAAALDALCAAAGTDPALSPAELAAAPA